MINSVIYDRGSVYVKFNNFKDPLVIPQFPHYVMTEDKSSAKYKSPFEEFGTNVDYSLKRRVNLTDMNQVFNKMIENEAEPRFNDNKWGNTFYIDIETGIGETFPEPSLAEQPITTISITSSSLKTVVLTYNPNYNAKRAEDMYWEIAGKILSENAKLKRIFDSDDKHPAFSILKCQNEAQLLNTFLKFVHDKCDYAVGWNFITFDWIYIYNRCFNTGVDWTQCCLNGMMENATHTDQNENRTSFKMPFGCQVLDLMKLVNDMDYSLGPKESMSLDYIANKCFNVGKLKYNYPLKELYDKDIDQYIAYNGIDTFLTAGIDVKCNTTFLLKEYCRIGTIPVYKCQSMIALTNALFNKHFNKQNMFIGENPKQKLKEKFQGGYVRPPRKGKHKWITCNDFAALYPSSIRTCNLSPESMIDYHLDEVEDKEKLAKYRSDPNFFVSINNNVYKNDKDYAFKTLQTYLTNERNPRKYIGKEINAKVLPVCDEMTQENIDKLNSLTPDTLKWIVDTYQIDQQGILDILNGDNEREKFLLKAKMEDAVEVLDIQQIAFKRYSNSLYGGVSNPACDYFKLACAEDVTGEGRNATHTMEKCTAYLWNSYIHTQTGSEKIKNLGLTFNQGEYNKSLQRQLNDGTYYHYTAAGGAEFKWFDNIVYGDTDSLYISYEDVLNWFDETRDADFDTRYEYMLKFIDFTNEYYAMMLLNYYKSRNCRSPEIQNFEIETLAEVGLHFMKKQYIQKLIWKDGKDLRHHPKLKKIGLEIVKGSTSAYARELLTKTLENMLEVDDFDWKNFLDSHYDEYCNAPLGEIAGNFKLNPSLYKKYLTWDLLNNEYVGLKGCPFQYKAAAAFNNIIINNKLLDVYQEIKDGKLHVMMATNDFGYIGFPDEDPLGDVKLVADKEGWWNKTIIDVIDRLAAKLDGRFDAEEAAKEERRQVREAKKLAKELEAVAIAEKLAQGIEDEKPKPKRGRKKSVA